MRDVSVVDVAEVVEKGGLMIAGLPEDEVADGEIVFFFIEDRVGGGGRVRGPEVVLWS